MLRANAVVVGCFGSLALVGRSSPRGVHASSIVSDAVLLRLTEVARIDEPTHRSSDKRFASPDAAVYPAGGTHTEPPSICALVR